MDWPQNCLDGLVASYYPKLSTAKTTLNRN